MLIFCLVVILLVVLGELEFSFFSYEWNLNHFGFQVGILSLIFLLTVFMVSIMVQVFSRFYMSGSKMLVEFNLWFSLFVLSMMTLLLGNSWWVLIFGWEMLGVTSFWLVAFYGSFLAHNGGILTMMTNRIGDVAFICALMYFLHYGSLVAELNFFMIVFIGLALVSKSAQFPFFSWLPAAMSAPTPISALVHSSTLVTAGFFLLMKFNWAYLVNSQFSYMFGIMTLLLGSWAALLDCDFKKVVAFSTLSQLGLLMILFSSGSLMVVLFHLVSHAFFKSVLFMNVGGMIFCSFSNQSKMLFGSGLMMNYIHVSWFYLSLMNLSALVFTTGFYSKESGLTSLLTEVSLFTLVLFVVVISLTTGYALRMAGMVSSGSGVSLSFVNGSSFLVWGSLLSWMWLVVLGFVWGVNFCVFDFGFVMFMMVMLMVGVISYWMMASSSNYLFYQLTRFLQYNMSFNWLRGFNQVTQLFWVPLYPLTWLSGAGWLALVTITLIMFV